MKRIGIIILATAAIVSSCSLLGKKSPSKLEEVIENEISKSLDGHHKCSVIELEKLDSTIFITEFDRRIKVFETRIEQNKKFHDDYYRRGLKKNAAIKYDEIYRDYEILDTLRIVKERMGDSLYMVAYYDYRVRAEVKTGGIVRRIIRRKSQILDDLYFAITPDNEILSMSTNRRTLHYATGFVIPGYSEIIKAESDSTEVIQDE